jgi:hypothetical protein
MSISIEKSARTQKNRHFVGVTLISDLPKSVLERLLKN